ncbi:MAG: geranylgeranylglyceryl/heptaprenylglyceryl phosphate synthase [Cytophagales bacterium]|nr:geranylgeranylglyceryl/heptaprenylglyceryl phosphate synthase [Cytophagales bacterium]
MTATIYKELLSKKQRGVKSFAVLLDPDKLTAEGCRRLVHLGIESKVDYFFVGGSLMTNTQFNTIVKTVKSNSQIPVVLFPGSNLQIDSNADAILLLSLISGRNADLLIGQHVIAAPIIKRSQLEVISTGYMLIDGGKPTTVSYISNTTPIPHDKPTIASCTAMAGEMLGLKLIYMDAGSGALCPVSNKMITMVNKSVSIPLIVGGGINSPEQAFETINAGADVIVIGNGIEKNPNLLVEVAERIQDKNAALNIN